MMIKFRNEDGCIGTFSVSHIQAKQTAQYLAQHYPSVILFNTEGDVIARYFRKRLLYGEKQV